MSESLSPLATEDVLPALDQIPCEHRTPYLLESMALVEVYSTVLYSLPSRPLRTFYPDADVDWITYLPLRSPSFELRTKIQKLNFHYLPQTDNLLLGLYYLLLLPIGQPIGQLPGSPDSEIGCFRQCLGFCNIQHDTTSDYITPLHYLAEGMTEKVMIEMLGFRRIRKITSNERMGFNLTEFYAWSILSSEELPAFPVWQGFIKSLRHVVEDLSLHEQIERLAISCLNKALESATVKKNNLKLPLVNLRPGPQPDPEADLTERLSRGARDARLRKAIERSWTVVPLPVESRALENNAGNTGSADIASICAEDGSKEAFIIPTLPQDSEASPTELLSASEESFFDTGYVLEEEIGVSSDCHLVQGSPTTFRSYSTTDTSSTLQGQSRTTGNYPSTPLSIVRSQLWLSSPSERPSSNLGRAKTLSEWTSRNRTAETNAKGPKFPAYQLGRESPRAPFIKWVKKVGKGIVNMFEKVRDYEDGSMTEDLIGSSGRQVYG